MDSIVVTMGEALDLRKESKEVEKDFCQLMQNLVFSKLKETNLEAPDIDDSKFTCNANKLFKKTVCL